MSDELFICRNYLPITRYDNCNCATGTSMPFYDYQDPTTWSELVRMVATENTEALKDLIRVSGNMRIVDRHANSPLHIAVILQKPKVVEFLLNLRQVRVNAINRYGQTSLHLAVISNLEEILLKLIQNGGDVNMGDEAWCTPLHTASTRTCPKLINILLDKGADINAQNLLGKTPLYHACQYGPLENIYLLLWKGAAAHIPDVYGVLPLTTAIDVSIDPILGIPRQFQEIHEILYNHTFEKHKMCLNLSIITVAMKGDSVLFQQILDKVERVKYSPQDLRELARVAMLVKWEHFRIVVQRFYYVIKELVKEPHELHYNLTNHTSSCDDLLEKFLNFLTALFKFRPHLNFIRGSVKFTYFIGFLVNLYSNQKLSLPKLVDAVLFSYSYGMCCEMSHLVVLYEELGLCDIVKQVLDLNIIGRSEKPKALMPYLLIDVNLTIEGFMTQFKVPRKQFVSALAFFSSPKVKKYFAEYKHAQSHLIQLPAVPSLIELARDVARKHIIDVFCIRETKDFYRLIKRLPISEVYKKILIYEKKLYRI